MWFYQENYLQKGPVDEETVKDLLGKRTLTRATPVWREGLHEWTPLNETELVRLIPPGMPPPIAPPPVRRPLDEGGAPQISSDLNSMWLAMTICIGVSAPLLFFGGTMLNVSGTELIGALLLVFAGLGSAAAVAIAMMLLHKTWSVLPRNVARTAPGKAVGFLFIPFFGFYWQFVSILGLAKDVNHYSQNRGISGKPVNEPLALSFCILNCVTWLPGLGLFAAIASAVIGVILWRSFVEFVAAMTQNPFGSFPQHSSPEINASGTAAK